jgi:predicted dehydrogenase
MARIKAVQIGVGHDHAYAVVQTLTQRNDIFDYVGYVVVDGEEEVYQQRKDLYKNVKRLTLEEAFAIDGLQAAFIETEDYNLTKYALLAAQRGLALQMDKPGGQDHAEFEQLVDYCQEKGIIFHTGYMYRYNPAVQYVLSKVHAGEFGKVYYVEVEMSSLQTKEKREWLKAYKGGMMNFLGCHLIDLLLQIQGVPQKMIPFNRSSGQDGVTAEDCAFAVFEYENGVSFIKTTAIESGGFMRRQLLICCEKATIELNPMEVFVGNKMATDVYITDADNARRWSYRGDKQTFGPFDRYENMYVEFADILLGKKENPYSYEYEKLLHKTLMQACGI